MKPAISLINAFSSSAGRETAYKRLIIIAKQLSTMSSKRVNLPSENKLGKVPAILNGDPKTTHGGIIIIQEWWGVNEQIENCGKEIAAKSGFVTIIPDLYRGKVATDHETAGHYFSDLDWQGAIQDIRASAKYLKSQGVKKVGVTGFCMGGALSMAAAALITEIDASAPFYGVPSTELCDVTTIKVPLQCHFAEKDDTAGFASPAEWKPLKAKLEASLKKPGQLEFHVYNAGHAFTKTDGVNYDKECCDLAMTRMYAFFKKHLS